MFHEALKPDVVFFPTPRHMLVFLLHHFMFSCTIFKNHLKTLLKSWITKTTSTSTSSCIERMDVENKSRERGNDGEYSKNIILCLKQCFKQGAERRQAFNDLFVQGQRAHKRSIILRCSSDSYNNFFISREKRCDKKVENHIEMKNYLFNESSHNEIFMHEAEYVNEWSCN